MNYGDTIVKVNVGDRVSIHPGHPLWLAGFRYGTVHKIGRKYVHIEAERLSRRRMAQVLPKHLEWVPVAQWLKEA